MVNSHFVPQFLLRNFCKDDKIQYFDIATKSVEQRSTKSVFSERGYYPDSLEKELCYKIEAQFANVLNKKIVNERYKISLDRQDMLILKKYLIITMLRVKDDNLDHNIWYRELIKSEILPEDDATKALLNGDFCDAINKVLNANDVDTLLEMTEKERNINLFTFIKDSVFSYNVFVRSNNSKQDFVITDRGWAGYRGPMGVKKLNAMFNMLEIRYDPFIDMLLHMSSPQDYAIYPLSSTMALIAMSPAYKICLPGAPYHIIYPDEAPSLSKCLGFGTADTIAPSDNRINRDGVKEYRYEIKQLTRTDVSFLNRLMIKQANNYFAYADESRIKLSLDEFDF